MANVSSLLHAFRMMCFGQAACRLLLLISALNVANVSKTERKQLQEEASDAATAEQ